MSSILAQSGPDSSSNRPLGHATALSSANWLYSTLDSGGEVGNYTSLALGSNNTVHIGYYDYSNDDLKYATNAGGSWTLYTLDSAGDVGQYASIAVDSNNKVHVSYLDWTNVDLKYATNAGGSWAYTTIDTIGDVGMFTSIAVDSNGKVHVSYLDVTNYNLKYATNADGTWDCHTLDSYGDVGFDTSIAVDSNDKVHISYGDWTREDLKYATNAAGSWATYTLDSLWSVGFDTSIAVDSNDKIHISYHDETNACLKYITNVGGDWANFTVDNDGYVGLASSIAVDGSNKVHISYCDYTDYSNSHLKYATNAGGSWANYTLDAAGDVGLDSSLAVDSRGIVHISYSEQINGDLKYVFGTQKKLPELAVRISASSAAGSPSLTVQFTSTVIGGLEPYNYSWTFGDGGTDFTQDPVHTYAAVGTYNVTLVVTDSMMTSKTVQKTLSVSYGRVVPAPGDDFLATPLALAAGAAITLAVLAGLAMVLLRRRSARAEQGRQALATKEQVVSSESAAVILPQRAPQEELLAQRPRAPDRVRPRLVRVEDKLFELRSMREKGLISEEEYEERTKELLKRW